MRAIELAEAHDWLPLRTVIESQDFQALRAKHVGVRKNSTRSWYGFRGDLPATRSQIPRLRTNGPAVTTSRSASLRIVFPYDDGVCTFTGSSPLADVRVTARGSRTSLQGARGGRGDLVGVGCSLRPFTETHGRLHTCQT